MQRKAYPSDLSDAEWEKLESLFPAAKPIGSPRQVDLREVMNAIFYWADNRVKWRALPDDFPAWQTVYVYFRRWVRTGLWEEINATLVAKGREKAGRKESPVML